jgi:hypothetical protein
MRHASSLAYRVMLPASISWSETVPGTPPIEPTSSKERKTLSCFPFYSPCAVSSPVMEAAETFRLLDLPADMIMEVAIRAVKSAVDPLRALRAVRHTCRDLKQISRRRPVLQSFPLFRGLDLTLVPSHRRSIIEETLAVGNPDALFIEAMRVSFRSFLEARFMGADDMPPMAAMEALAEEGHQGARFVIAMILFRADGGLVTNPRARELIRIIEGDTPIMPEHTSLGMRACVLPMHQYYIALRCDLWRDGPHQDLQRPPLPELMLDKPCTADWCGYPEFVEHWTWCCWFCSEGCRACCLLSEVFY